MESNIQWRHHKAINSGYSSLAIEWKNVVAFSFSTYQEEWSHIAHAFLIVLFLAVSIFLNPLSWIIHVLSSLCRYGELQGLNKQETADRFGKEKVHEWRRSYDIPPPNGESLEMCAQRAVAYFKDNVTSIAGFIWYLMILILYHFVNL